MHLSARDQLQGSERPFRTLLEQKIKERRQTLEEFVESAEAFAREHGESGTLSLRHLNRLVAGRGPKGAPLGPLRPATARLLESILGLSVDELLKPPAELSRADIGDQQDRVLRSSGPLRRAVTPQPADPLIPAFEWLDQGAGWISDTARRKVTARLSKLDTGELLDQHARRARVSRSHIARALSDYYQDQVSGYGPYSVRCDGRRISTSIVTRPDWQDLACSLTPDHDRFALVRVESAEHLARDGVGARHAVHRLAEAAALNVRMTNSPIYRLLGIDVKRGAISGTVGLAPFVEYALTMDLLEGELIDAVTATGEARRGALPLRDRYLPDLASVLGISGRLCAGGAVALCAIARPADTYRGPDYALLVQERSGNVLNATGRLSVIPKAFHEPLTDHRADTPIHSTLLREMEEELFGRSEVDSTRGGQRIAAPMHPSRLSEPMRWLLERPDRLRMECTGFGLNLVSGNFEFACLVVIEDEEFWPRYGGHVEANWESAGLRLYSSLDRELTAELTSNESWSNEGLFALLQGFRRLAEIGGRRVDLPEITAMTATGR
jgi:hypothetical protein